MLTIQTYFSNFIVSIYIDTLLNKSEKTKNFAQKCFGSMTWIAKRPLGHRVAYPNLIKIIMS